MSAADIEFNRTSGIARQRYARREISFAAYSVILSRARHKLDAAPVIIAERSVPPRSKLSLSSPRPSTPVTTRLTEEDAHMVGRIVRAEVAEKQPGAAFAARVEAAAATVEDRHPRNLVQGPPQGSKFGSGADILRAHRAAHEKE